MFEVRQTDEFRAWLTSLRDARARTTIVNRLARLAMGLKGDTKSIGDGVSELRIDYGPGYRAYYTERRRTLVIILCGGDKSSQDRDIKRAKAIAKEIDHDA
jgi:putative addiction module killer protein